MPVIYRTSDYILLIHHHDHNPLHIHYVSAEYDAVFDIATARLIAGTVAKRRHKHDVIAWIAEHRVELQKMWNEITQ